MTFPVNDIRNDFPILETKISNSNLIYFDNGATTQKPKVVIDRLANYYIHENSNVHRGAHYLSQTATESFENARNYTAGFINAQSSKNIIFTKGTTESINLVANGFADFITQGDEIIISQMEHHSNLVPWQQLCIKNGAKLKVVNILPDGRLDVNDFKKLISDKTKLVAITHISNVLGTINPVKEIVEIAHKVSVPVLIDGAQAIAHVPVDVNYIDCEFYAFSAHKAYGPMGVGVLYGKKEWLNKLSPYHYGGEMISNVTIEKTTFNELPYKFEAGTPNVGGVLGMEEALRYIETIGITSIKQYEDRLLEYASNKLESIKELKIIGTASEKTAVLSFIIDGIHPYDLGTLLDQMGVAIRTGNHCAQPLVDSLGITGTIRASFAIYNTFEEVDLFFTALKRAILMLQ